MTESIYAGLDKPALRRILSARRQALCEDERAEIQAILLSRLLSHPYFRCASVVCGYMSTRGELDMLPLWQAVVAAGKTYALPVTLTDAGEGQMVFRKTPDFCPEKLVTGRFSILEPPDTPAFPILSFDPSTEVLILVPGLGFDREGFRIGYGGGYYDRLFDALASHDHRVHTIGLCPSVCRVDKLPRECHDRAVDAVMDETCFS